MSVAKRALAWGMACALFGGVAASARPFTIDDLLHLQDLGPAAVDPTGRWLILAVAAPYDRAPRFDNDTAIQPLLTHLERVDLRRVRAPVAAFPQSPTAGYTSGPFSPTGARMVVFRDQGRRWEAGVVTLSSGKVRWLGVGAELADYGDTVLWRADDELLILALDPRDSPYRQRFNQTAMSKLPSLWRRASRGAEATAVTLGAGRYRDIHPQRPARRLLSIDMASGRTHELARGSFESLSLAPDGQHLALVETYGRVSPAASTLMSVGTPWERRRLRLLDLRTRQQEDLSPDHDILSGSLRWSSRSDALLAYARRSTEADWANAQFIRIGASGEAQPLATLGLKPSVTPAPGLLTPTPHADWLGETPLIFAKPEHGARSDWFELTSAGAKNLTTHLADPPAEIALRRDGEGLIMLDQGRPWSISPQGEAVRLGGVCVERTFPPRRLNTTVPLLADGAPHLPYLMVEQRTDAGRELWSLRPDGVARLAELPGGDGRVIAASTAGALLEQRNAHGVLSLDWVDRLGRSRRMKTLNSRLSDIDFSAPIAVEHPGPRGEPFRSWLYMPTTRRFGPRPPLLVMGYPGAVYDTPPYGGRPGVVDPIDDNAQLAAAHGYAVLIPSLPQDPQAVETGGGWDVQILGIVQAVARRGDVDTSRTAFWGQSFGGYAALNLAVRTNAFKAIVAAAAPSDLVSLRGDLFPSAWLSPEWPLAMAGMNGWTELGTQGHLMATPWSERERYLRNSPVFHADQIQTPVLIVQGDQDFVGVDQGREMFTDLYRLDKDALFVTFFGEGHVITSPANMRMYAALAYRFLDDHLR